MTTSDKDTIYIDIDDEITGIIDKLKDSQGKVVALVLPKRAAVFQSIVNMKLLKRAADSSSKHLVLITSEAGLLPLAGAAGIHVAKTLTSKPEIPSGPEDIGDEDEAVSEDSAKPEVDKAKDARRPIGELAGATAVAKATSDGVETLELDDEELAPEEGVKTKDFTPPKGKKNKKLRIPNFERFRLLLVGGGLLLFLVIFGFIFGAVRLPKATINITTDASSVDANTDLNLSTTATAFDADGNTTPAKLQTQQKTYTQQVPTTGQKNNGNKASGSVVFYDCDQGDLIFGQSPTIPAGTGISNNGQTYITQQSVSVPPSHFGNDGCKNDQPSSPVSVIAQSPGASSNASSNSKFSVNYTNPYSGKRSFTATSSSGISGGTDSIVQSVNQNDINAAKAKITPSDTDVKQGIETQLKQAGYYPIVPTYISGAPAITQSAEVGDTANNVTVTEVVTYTMFGVHKADLETAIKQSVQGQIDTGKQTLLDNGLNSAVYDVQDITATTAKIGLSTKATVGPDLDINTIKKQVAGQRAGAIKAELGNNPDVTGVEVKLSPFWVTTVPKKADRITVNIAKPKTTVSKPHVNNP